ncbi:MAG: diguanylate cyclase [Oscillospiraceae bacterium]|jgi:diguanylate cyclase (GGDEF)-like protein|nr:diguanylate cyclase [Oscillospiraceae bacterium]
MATLTATGQPEAMWYHDIFTNPLMLILYAIPLLVFINMAIRGFVNRRNVRLPVNLGLIWGAYAAWILVLLLRFSVADEAGLYIMTFLPYVFSVLTLTFTLYFVLRFYNQGLFLNGAVIAACQVVPVLTLILIIIGQSTGVNQIRHITRIALARGDPNQNINYIYGEFGSWHNFLELYNALLIAVIALIIFTKHFQLPKIYRDSSKRLISGVIFLMIGAFINGMNMVAGQVEMGVVFPVDFRIFTMMIAVQFFYRASLGNQGLVFLSQARSDIINCLDQSVLILDGEKSVTYANGKATAWMEAMGIKQGSYLTVIDRLLGTATSCERLSDESGGSDFYFDTEDGTKAFNLREKPIVDKKNRPIGTYVVYSDVTENRALIQRLEVGAGRDALTGLRNRGMMEHLKTELDKPDSLPLSVIVCDLNDLKVTNDTYGHQQGDIMLRVAGEVIAELLPPVAQAGRMGGDEFLILLPQTSREDARALSRQINDHLLGIDEYPYKITLAMGVDTKTEADQELSKVIVSADEAMYKHKKDMKGTVRSKSSIAC